MSLLTPFKLGAKITSGLQARPGQLVYTRDRTSITGCFYELLYSQGLALSPKESDYLDKATHGKHRPCIILDQLPDRGYTVCFIAQLHGAVFSPIGRFFGVRIGGTSRLDAAPPRIRKPTDLSLEWAASFPPLRLTDGPGPRPEPSLPGTFYLYGIPVVRDKIQLFPGEPRHLIDGELQRAIELVRGRVTECWDHHLHLRRDQLRFFEERGISWRYNNPRQMVEHRDAYLRL